MSSICRIASYAINTGLYRHGTSWLLSASKTHAFDTTVAYYSDKCGSDKKGSDSSKSNSDDPSKPCEPCCPCNPSCCGPCPPRDPSDPTMYDKRKYGHELPNNDVNVNFEPLPNIPTGIFRNTDCEVLGLCAGKLFCYKNPEYFSFHHMTYYDMHMILKSHRLTQLDSKKKP